MIHNWQHTGQQKELFARSANINKKYHNDTLKKIGEKQIKADAQCPFQYGEFENHLHYMECTSTEAVKLRGALTKRFTTILEELQVHDDIIYLLLWGIKWHGKKVPPTCNLINGPINDAIQQAIGEQTIIGWHNVRRGFISQKWADAQNLTSKQKKYPTHTNWSKLFVKQLLHISWTMRTHRNSALHGSNQKEIRERHLQSLQEKVDLAYTSAKELQVYNKKEITKVFRLSIHKRKKYGVVALESWLKLANKVLEKASAQATTKMEQWLQRKSTYIEQTSPA